ncbi:MAG: arsinothricin resistance N-acetyltransferase ArsN1 [Candidatus Limnocylindria bacterium]|nr:arsinothricin resistance N-acetyltransferase ArsN1 [Candidatus Limnocylindria bacterium]
MERRYVIRTATAADAETIARVHNEGIADRVATLDTEWRTAEDRQRWLAERGPHHPVVVAEAEGRVVGWASLNVFNPREAYRHVADLSVYVAREARGRGAGTALLQRVIELAHELGFHKLVLAAMPWNAAGIALYRREGFREVGTYREQGLLDGRWVDVVVMERLFS